MNILLMTIGRLEAFSAHGIYPDLIRQWILSGHHVYAVGANERRTGRRTELFAEDGGLLMRVGIGNLTKCGLLEKGVSMFRITGQYRRAIKRAFPDVRFDLIVYSTPPITLARVVKRLKSRDNAATYLLLKDIFPQNAVDIGLMKTGGPAGLLLRWFRGQERQLYALSDRIGCMSAANVRYLLQHNPELTEERVEVFPNCVELLDCFVSENDRIAIRERYHLPTDRKIFVYGGNLGKPQDIPFVISCLRACADKDAFFLIVGDGTEYEKLNAYVEAEKPSHICLMRRLPKDDYDRMIVACDCGLIFLDHRFTIPNFPSRLLAYMQASLPVICCTDPNTDIGDFVEKGGFGWKCFSDDPKNFILTLEKALSADLRSMGKRAFACLRERYDVSAWAELPLHTVGKSSDVL